MKITITNRQVLDIFSGLKRLNSEIKYKDNERFIYAINKNLDILRAFIKRLDAVYSSNANFERYDRERVNLLIRFAKTNENNEVITEETANGSVFVLEDQEAFNKEFEKLQIKYKEIIKERKRQLKVFNEMLDESVEVDFYSIYKSNLPKKLTPQQMIDIQLLIAEDL